MAISEFEIKRCEKELDKYLSQHRPPPSIRHEIDLAYRIEDQSVVVFEIVPHWKNTDEKIENPVAKTTYVKRHEHWKVFWYRSDMAWHSYEPVPTVKYLEDFISLISEDANACFYG